MSVIYPSSPIQFLVVLKMTFCHVEMFTLTVQGAPIKNNPLEKML